jgi:hypothetical protein
MKAMRLTICLGIATLYSHAATKPVDWGISGIPTPLEEFGLTIGDVSVSRVFNPIGQLKGEDSVMISRRFTDIANPWLELAKGTGLIVDGKKAVVRSIDPPVAPKTKATGLRVKLEVEEIAGTRMILEWEQKTTPLNSAETAIARADNVNQLKSKLRVGTHIILYGSRVVVSKQSLRYASPTSRDNKDLQLEAQYYNLSGGRGTVSGVPNGSESITDIAWRLNQNANPMAQNSAELVTWEFRSRDGDTDNIPPVTVLHRMRGVVATLELPSEDKEHARNAHAHIQTMHHGQVHTHLFKWKQDTDNNNENLWSLTDSRADSVEFHRVNDTNIRFQITPDSLLKANREAAKFFKAQNNNTRAQRKRIATPILDASTLQSQIENLTEIVKSDASETIKMDAKRQAVIYLARFYEHEATRMQAYKQEQLFRAQLILNDARKYERAAWLNRRKMQLLQDKAAGQQVLSNEPEASQSDDLNVPDRAITEIHDELKAYPAKVFTVPTGTIPVIYADLLRQKHTLESTAAQLRNQAKTLTDRVTKRQKPNSNDELSYDQSIARNYALALQFWSEYIHRSEGIMEGAAKLAEQGVEYNRPAPDPYIPEILLRQAWIFQQLGQTERAISTNFDVLSSAAKQRITNLTRFERIANLAYSQIANLYYDNASKPEDYQEAIDRFSNILRSNENDSVQRIYQEIDPTQVKLKLLRSLFQSDSVAHLEIRRLQRKLEAAKSAVTKQNPESADAIIKRKIYKSEEEEIQGEIAVIKLARTKRWTLLKDHATAFINRYTESNPDFRYDGEVRYYEIMAHKALSNEEHVRRGIEVLLENESTPEELRHAWFSTRVRVWIDVANLLFSNATIAEQERVQQPNANPHTHALPDNLEGAILYYRWALKHDVSYRSQIMLRQQIAFCQERLLEIEEAQQTFIEIHNLCEMHEADIQDNPTLKVVKTLTKFRLENLKQKIQHKINSQN